MTYSASTTSQGELVIYVDASYFEDAVYVEELEVARYSPTGWTGARLFDGSDCWDLVIKPSAVRS